jgi:hypothetical protein
MSNDLSVPLKVGETYTVDDVYGMVCFNAVYHGLVEQDIYPRKRLLLFKILNPVGCRWAGADADAHPTREGISIRLVARHYGDEPQKLKAWNESKPERKPKWVRVKE